jgi:ferritin-like metal-binding protein YciE
MSETSTDSDLLLTCVQDLYAACSAFARRFPMIVPFAKSGELRAAFEELVKLAEARGRQLQVTEGATDGPENLWMAGMLDDAVRDTQTVTHGRLLDIALIGAVRKMLVAEFVSTETAIILARQLAREPLTSALAGNHAELRDLDSSLSSVLDRIAGSRVG